MQCLFRALGYVLRIVFAVDVLKILSAASTCPLTETVCGQGQALWVDNPLEASVSVFEYAECMSLRYDWKMNSDHYVMVEEVIQAVRGVYCLGV